MTGYLLLLTAMGLIAFALFGAIYEVRIGGRTLSESPRTTADESSVAMMRTGAAGALSEAVRLAEEGRRSEATHALDAALRTLEVGAEAFRGDYGHKWRAALKQAKQAQASLQNGAPMRMTEQLRAAADIIRSAPIPAAPPASPDTQLQQYAGATLLNAAGIRIGELLTPMQNDNKTAEIAVGGVRDLLGFLDWGGRTISVESGRLVYGPARWPKPIMVVLPTLESEPSAILSDLQRARGSL